MINRPNSSVCEVRNKFEVIFSRDADGAVTEGTSVELVCIGMPEVGAVAIEKKADEFLASLVAIDEAKVRAAGDGAKLDMLLGECGD